MNIGANRWDRVDKIALQGCLISGGFTLLAAGAIFALGDLIELLLRKFFRLIQRDVAIATEREAPTGAVNSLFDEKSLQT